MAINISVNKGQSYYYNNLAPDLQRVLDDCLRALCAGQSEVRLNTELPSPAEDSLGLVLEAIDNGFPELFFFDKQATAESDGDGIIIRFSLKYSIGDIERMWRDLSEAADRIADYLRTMPTEFDRISYLNKYICSTVKTNPSTEGRYGDAYSSLISKEARCEGIAKGVQLVLNRLGMSGVIAVGKGVRDGNSEDHAWNIINVDGVPYGFDFTWNIDATAFGVTGVDYAFLDGRDMALEHTPNPKYSYPITDSSRLTYWYRMDTVINYRSDFSSVRFREDGYNSYAIMRLANPVPQDEMDMDSYGIFLDEMGGDAMYGRFAYRYNETLGVLTFYLVTYEE